MTDNGMIADCTPIRFLAPSNNVNADETNKQNGKLPVGENEINLPVFG